MREAFSIPMDGPWIKFTEAMVSGDSPSCTPRVRRGWGFQMEIFGGDGTSGTSGTGGTMEYQTSFGTCSNRKL